MAQVSMKSPGDNLLSRLLDHVRLSNDPYQVAALYPWLSISDRVVYEPVIFAHRRYPRLFAQAAYTPVSLLQRLAQESDSLTLDKLVKNPTTPTAVLNQLAQRSQGHPRLRHIAAHPNADAALLDSLDEVVLRKAICWNPNTSLSQLNRLLPTASLDECKGMAKNPKADLQLLATLWQTWDDPYLHAEIAAHRHCPENLLNAAVVDDKWLLRRKAAANPRLSQEKVVRLLTDSQSQVRAATLRHLGARNIKLINQPARRVRRELARQSGLDERVIESLSMDKDSWVRRWIARNPVTPTTLLEALATDDEAEVRRGVARNPLTPGFLCKQLASDVDSWVRAGIAIRHDLDSDIIEQLSIDESVDVLAGLGRNPLTSPELLAKIALHRDRDVRRSVILNKQTPLPVLQLLLEDSYPLNRALLCRHTAMSSFEHWQLIDDPEPQVRFSAVQALASLNEVDC